MSRDDDASVARLYAKIAELDLAAEKDEVEIRARQQSAPQ